MYGIVILVAFDLNIERNKMSKRVIKKQYTEEYVEATRQDLRRLQHWFDGFEAAGGKIPQCLQGLCSLHAAIRILHDYNAIK